MSKILVPISMEVVGYVEVEADSLEAAFEYVSENIHTLYPTEEEWVHGSQQLCVDGPEDLTDLNNMEVGAV